MLAKPAASVYWISLSWCISCLWVGMDRKFNNAFQSIIGGSICCWCFSKGCRVYSAQAKIPLLTNALNNHISASRKEIRSVEETGCKKLDFFAFAWNVEIYFKQSWLGIFLIRNTGFATKGMEYSRIKVWNFGFLVNNVHKNGRPQYIYIQVVHIPCAQYVVNKRHGIMNLKEYFSGIMDK